MRHALVTGAGGFIGGHLVKRLKREGYWVRGVDVKEHEFSHSPADEFMLLDLRDSRQAAEACTPPEPFQWAEVYALAADMGGMGFIQSHAGELVVNNALINANTLRFADCQTYFFASSACVYPDMPPDAPEIDESGAYPAMPDNEYGWEKLFAERALLAHHPDPRIARFQNCYGPECAWMGGREKAPAALCRKMAEAVIDGNLEIWGDGTALRQYIFVDDLIEGIRVLMQSECREPVNIGTDDQISVDELAARISIIADKSLFAKYVPGPVGVAARAHSSAKMRALGWSPRVSLDDGLTKLYDWVAKQVDISAKV